MKTVFLVRHAKSSWENDYLADINRPLNDRGLRDAAFMARLLRDKGIKPDVLISSPAVRALTTAGLFKTELAIAGKDLVVRDEIYEAGPSSILYLIASLPEAHNTVMLFGHNPTFTSVTNLFSSDFIANMPTCGVAGIHAAVSHWVDFRPGKATLKEYFYPKQFL